MSRPTKEEENFNLQMEEVYSTNEKLDTIIKLLEMISESLIALQSK